MALLELLEQEDKERQELQSQGTLAEDATQEPGFTETEGQNGMEPVQEGMEFVQEEGGETVFPETEYGEDGQQGGDLAA